MKEREETQERKMSERGVEWWLVHGGGGFNAGVGGRSRGRRLRENRNKGRFWIN